MWFDLMGFSQVKVSVRCFLEFGVSVKPSFHGGLPWIEGRPSRIEAVGPYGRAISIFLDIPFSVGQFVALSLCFLNNLTNACFHFLYFVIYLHAIPYHTHI